MRTHTAVHLPARPATDESPAIPEGWHYASVSRRGGYPLGYCADHDPHPTEAEARACYATWQRDNIRLDIRYSNWTGCEARTGTPNPSGRPALCDAPTKTAAGITGDGYHQAALCTEHLTIEHAVTALGLDRPAGDAWVS